MLLMDLFWKNIFIL